MKLFLHRFLILFFLLFGLKTPSLAAVVALDLLPSCPHAHAHEIHTSAHGHSPSATEFSSSTETDDGCSHCPETGCPHHYGLCGHGLYLIGQAWIAPEGPTAPRLRLDGSMPFPPPPFLETPFQPPRV